MCRQLPHRTSAAARPGRNRAVRMGARRVAAVSLATGVLIGSNLTTSIAQQSPDTWSADHRAVLPSGLTVQLDFAPASGVSATPVPGKLAGATYTDGLRPGDPAETFLVADQHPHTDGAWRTTGTLRLSFSRAVRNPRLHLSGLAASAGGAAGTTTTAARLTVTDGSPSAPKLTGRTPWPGWTVTSSTLGPAGDGTTDGSSDGSGTVELTGTLSSVSFRVEQRSTALAGSTTPPPQLRHTYTVTLDEDLGTAPQQYGNASHLVSDLFLGQDAAGPSNLLLPGPQSSGSDRRGSSADRSMPRLQPGRGEYKGADPTLKFPADTAIGGYYDLTVPVSTGGGPAVLAGWIDFDHSGHFAPAQRVQAEIPAGATSAVLEWIVPDGTVPGETWARLRIARSGAQVVGSGGFADSGEVVDQKIQIAVGPAKPEIIAPVSGTFTADDRSPLWGDRGATGATVAITEGDATLCQGAAGSDGSWTCRPGGPLAQGPHSLVPVESTGNGTLRGEPIRLVVKKTPPSAPAFALPEYSNDPDLLLSGSGEPDSTVWVTDSGVDGRGGGDVCVTSVLADSTWSCLPVENLADGRHQLNATAIDQAGNRTDGKPAALTVITVAPAKPVLDAPTPGSTLYTARPQLTGRAQSGATVTVTVPGAGGERTALCSAAVASDGSWSCTPTSDLADDDRTLVAVVTDRAGNSTAGDPITVHIAAPAVSPSASASPSTSPAQASPSGAASSSPAAPAGVSASPSAAAGDPSNPPQLQSVVVPPVATTPQPSPARSRTAPAQSPAPTSSAASPHDGPRPLAAPPAARGDRETDTSSRRRELPSWRIAAWSALLTLVALGLLVRRVLGRGPGARRR